MKVIDKVTEELAKLSNMVAAYWVSERIEDFEAHEIVSPPEQIFYANWAFMDYGESIELVPQYKVGGYRVDFKLNFMPGIKEDFINNPDILTKAEKDFPLVAIEIDGHIWHEKTPEQVERDKKRERAIVAEGYKVIRFSAREIFRDPDKYVTEVFWGHNSHLPEFRNAIRSGKYGDINK